VQFEVPVLECALGKTDMEITIDAVYESGVLKPLQPIDSLKEHDRVRLVLRQVGIVTDQRSRRINIDPAAAQEIGESADLSILSD
jgi:predicted DNA-binding antitoxin AbrB/MazE fold protein